MMCVRELQEVCVKILSVELGELTQVCRYGALRGVERTQLVLFIEFFDVSSESY